ncbi:MAG: hypothetical protein HY038_11175 [Nitrospirae bacterium]|nr:hypothetical protein [Nitrospirota bacterium]
MVRVIKHPTQNKRVRRAHALRYLRILRLCDVHFIGKKTGNGGTSVPLSIVVPEAGIEPARAL